MWTLWGSLRRVWKLLHSGLTPTQIALGFCLGLTAGLVPWGLNTLVWLTLAFALNVGFSAALLAFALFKLLAWPLLPVGYALGRAILSVEALDPLWQRLFYSPVLAWLELWRYAVFGGYVLASLMAVPAFFGVRAFVRAYREEFFELLERSRPWQALSRREKLFRLVQWLLFGGGARFRDARRRFGPFRIVRRQALIALPPLALLAYGLIAAVVPFVIEEGLARGASFLLGGEVRIEKATANAFTGRVGLQGLVVQNPQGPNEDVLRVRSITADLSVISLLLGRRLAFDEIAIGEIFLHVKRERDGSLNLDDLVDPTSPDWREYFEWIRQNAQKIDWLKLWQRYGGRYGRVVWERLKGRLLDRLAPAAVPPAEAQLLRDRKPLPPPWPVLTLKRVRVERLHLKLTDEFAPASSAQGGLPPITAVDVLVENVAWDPKLGREPITLGLKAYWGQRDDGGQATLMLSATFDERQEPPTRTLALEAKDFDLAAYRALYEHTLPVLIERGRAALAAKIVARGRELQGQAQLRLTDLALLLPEDEDISLFGLDPQASRQVVRGINAYAEKCPIVMGVAITGTPEQPKLHWDEAFLKIAKRGLLMLGTLPFAPVLSQIDAKLGELARLPLPGLEEGALKGALEGLLKGQLGLQGTAGELDDECALGDER